MSATTTKAARTNGVPPKTRGAPRRAKAGARTVMPIGKRSEAAFQLSSLGISKQFIATTIGCAASQVTRWCAAETRPNEKQRELIEKHFGVASNLWDLDKAARTVPDVDAPLTMSFAEVGEKLFRRLARRVHEADTGTGEFADATPSEINRLLVDIVKMYETMLERMHEDEQFATLVMMPAWKRYVGLLMRALEPFPDATDAVVRMLDQVVEAAKVGG